MLGTSNKTTTIRCRGYVVEIYPVKGTKTMTRALYTNAVVYFSGYEPIAIKYKNGIALMNFKHFGDDSVRDKIMLREYTKYETILERQFDGELFRLLSRP